MRACRDCVSKRNARLWPLAHAGNAEAVAASRQAAQREGLFRDVNLDWLKSVKEWLKFQPEKDEPVLRMELHSLPDDRGMESHDDV